MTDMVIELSDGSEVRLHEVWNCCDGIHDSGSMIEVYNNEDDSFMGAFLGSLPDADDEDFDFDMDDFVECLEEICKK